LSYTRLIDNNWWVSCCRCGSINISSLSSCPSSRSILHYE